eukprot:COSAG01_NODE_5466_length_4243_cov_77.924469_1_plen_70_part_00
MFGLCQALVRMEKRPRVTEICVPGASSDHDITARCSHQLRLHDRLAEMFEHQLRAALPLLAGTYVHAGR